MSFKSFRSLRLTTSHTVLWGLGTSTLVPGTTPIVGSSWGLTLVAPPTVVLSGPRSSAPSLGRRLTI